MFVAIGRVHPGEDVVVFLSHSGRTEECIIPARQLKDKGTTCLCVVSQPGKSLYTPPAISSVEAKPFSVNNDLNFC